MQGNYSILNFPKVLFVSFVSDIIFTSFNNNL